MSQIGIVVLKFSSVTDRFFSAERNVQPNVSRCHDITLSWPVVDVVIPEQECAVLLKSPSRTRSGINDSPSCGLRDLLIEMAIQLKSKSAEIENSQSNLREPQALM
jgi:hypothetical protein